MTVCYRAEYLVIMYEFGSCKNILAVVKTGYGSKIQLQADNCKGQQTVQPTTSQDTLTWIETQITNADRKGKKLDSTETIGV